MKVISSRRRVISSIYYWKERFHAYMLKSPNKQLMHTFLHFVVSLQSRFYSLGLIFVFDMNIIAAERASLKRASEAAA